MNELPRTIREAAELLRGRKTSALDLAELALARAHADRNNAWLHLSDDHARAQARAADARLRGGEAPVLTGIPWACKDIIGTKGIPTTAGSRILEGYVPAYSATVVERLDAQGAVVLGKTNLDEFAMGASTENSGFFASRNPHDVKRVPGGSSGGSAAAVAGGLAPLALGSDTGGSVRQPGSLCGVVGLRPTYGVVSRYGLVAFASSLDQVGPLALNVEDCTLLMDVIAGHDGRDSTSRPRTWREISDATKDRSSLAGLRIGIPSEYKSEGVDREVRALVERCEQLAVASGAKLVPLSLPLTQYAIPTYYLVVTSEASSNLARFEGVRYGPRAHEKELVAMYGATRAQGFGDEVKRRIMLGTFALSAGYFDAYYKKALQVRQRILQEFTEAFTKCDFVLGPTAPTAAFPIGEKASDPVQMYLCDVFTAPAPLAGLPALSIPCGTSAGGLPIGVQLQGPACSDFRMLRVARELEKLLALDLAPCEPGPAPGAANGGAARGR